MGAGFGRRTRPGQQTMRAAKRQALTGSAPGQAGSSVAGATGGAGSSRQQSGSGQQASLGNMPSFPGSWSSSKPRRGRYVNPGSYSVKQKKTYDFLEKEDVEVDFAEVVDADQELRMPAELRKESVRINGKEHAFDALEGVRRADMDPSSAEAKFGSFILPGLATITGARRVDDDWVVTIFADKTWAIANTNTNQIGCSCGTRPCHHRVAALLNAKINNDELTNVHESLVEFSSSNKAGYEGYMGDDEWLQYEESSDGVGALYDARLLAADALVDDKIVFDSTEANARLQAYGEQLRKEFEDEKAEIMSHPVTF